MQIASAIDLAAENALPQGYPSLGSGPRVPTVLLKAIAWVESGWQQFRAPDQPLVSHDGGYGIMQITDGLGGLPVTAPVQSAIANNFVYNIACGAWLLSAKWLTTPRIGTGDPSVLEDWYYTVWAYNNWSWRNNPNNPIYKRSGTPASNPTAFPYQERVFYAIAHPPLDATGRPLWPAVPVTLPDPKTIGKTPGALPAPALPHYDAAPADGPLPLPRGDAAQFKADLSLPDGTAVAPGAPLHKTWLLRNAGNLFWQDYTWRFIGGDRMDAPVSVTVPLVPPLADVALNVDMVAPAQPHAYKGYWQLFNQEGQPVGGRAWADITVSDALTATTGATATTPLETATPSATGVTTTLDPSPLSTPPVSATVQSVHNPAVVAVDNAAYVADVTIPDGTVLAPGQRFTKGWEIQNTGTRTWDKRYSWQFEAGAPMGTVRQVGVSSRVPPGGTARFLVQMVAPTRPGSYRGFWQMTDSSGNVFGSQAWVAVTVAGAHPTATPAATTAATATPQPTATPAPSFTATPRPTASPTPSATPRPTATPLPTAVPWFGPASSHAFFAEGYTGGGYHEYLSLLNPRGHVMRAQVTIYRTDGATRILALRLSPLSRRTLDLNVLAPRSSTALRVEADSQAVVERAQYTANGHIVAGAPLPSRHWYVAEGYVGGGYRDELRMFNPYDNAAAISIKAYRGDGSILISHRLIRGGTRLNVSLDDVAPIGSSGLEIESSAPVVVESVVRAPHASGPTAAMALTTLSRLWYFPDGSTSAGNKEYIALLNPNPQTATVHLHPVTSQGYLPWATLHLAPYTRAVYVVHGLLHRSGLAAIVGADRPIAAQEIRYASSGSTTLVNGAAGPARSWGLAEGYTGNGFKQWITLLNPGDRTATVRVRLLGPHNTDVVVTMRERPRHRDYLYVNHLVPTGPVAAVITADRPIVAGRTMIFNGGKGLSTTIGVALQ